jgi:hypothetical protein
MGNEREISVPDTGMAQVSEQQAVRRARAITYELEALTGYIERIAAERRSLVRDLAANAGWSQHRIAAELGISQPAVSMMIKKQEAK